MQATRTYMYTMPSHGVEIIEGIPVLLKGSDMYAFQIETASPTPLLLGTYCPATKKAEWKQSDQISSWLTNFKETLVSKARK